MSAICLICVIEKYHFVHHSRVDHNLHEKLCNKMDPDVDTDNLVRDIGDLLSRTLAKLFRHYILDNVPGLLKVYFCAVATRVSETNGRSINNIEIWKFLKEG